jgi:hypothetical protein
VVITKARFSNECSIQCIVALPGSGEGDTLFSDVCTALDALSPELKYYQ